MWKNASNKSCLELNFLQKKISRHMSLSPSGVKLRGSKDCNFWNVIMHLNGTVGLLSAECCKKYGLYEKML